MVLSPDVINLLFYCVQQLGVTLAVGAAMVLLVQYVIVARDGVVDEKEGVLMRAVAAVRLTGLIAIIGSGLLITALHLMAGNSDTIFSPAYLFKWTLLAVVLVVPMFGSTISRSITEAIVGGSWLALFLVHILAPVTDWMNLLTFYLIWMLAFGLGWASLLKIFEDKKSQPTMAKIETPKMPPAPAPKPPVTTVAPPIPKPTPAPVVPPKPLTPPAPTPVVAPPKSAPAPVVTPTPAPAPKPPMPPAPAKPATPPVVIPPAPITKAPEKPIEDPDKNPNLPAIRVMPQKPEDIQSSNRAMLVKLD